jgi:hypothetical protein
MNALKIAALALIVAGILGLMYGGLTYTKGRPRTVDAAASTSLR